MKKINLLFIIGTFFPAQAGGPDNSVYWLNKAILKNKKKYNCLVLSFFHKLELRDINKYRIKPNKICSINGVKVIFFNFLIFRILNFYFWKFLFTKIKNYNFVHLNSFFFPIIPLSVLILRLFRIKHCISLRGELEDFAFQHNFLKKKIFFNFYKIIYNKNSFFHCTTEKEKNKSIKVLTNRNKFEIFPNYISKDILNMYRPIKKNGYLYLGRLHPKKNIEKIILAFNKAKEIKKSKSKLYIVGDGERDYELKLKNLSQNLIFSKDIIFSGKKNFIEKFRFLNKVKFLIFFSKTENFGNVILESLSCRTPVIVSNNLPWKSVKKEKAGYYISNNINSLTKQIIKSENLSQKEYKRLQNQTNKLFKKFIIDNKINDILKIYNKYL